MKVYQIENSGNGNPKGVFGTMNIEKREIERMIFAFLLIVVEDAVGLGRMYCKRDND